MTAAALTRGVRRGGWPSRGTTAAGQSSWRSDCIYSRGRPASAKIAMTTHVYPTGNGRDLSGQNEMKTTETDSRRVDKHTDENSRVTWIVMASQMNMMDEKKPTSAA
jgi:hypothetical protein